MRANIIYCISLPLCIFTLRFSAQQGGREERMMEEQREREREREREQHYRVIGNSTITDRGFID